MGIFREARDPVSRVTRDTRLVLIELVPLFQALVDHVLAISRIELCNLDMSKNSQRGFVRLRKLLRGVRQAGNNEHDVVAAVPLECLSDCLEEIPKPQRRCCVVALVDKEDDTIFFSGLREVVWVDSSDFTVLAAYR